MQTTQHKEAALLKLQSQIAAHTAKVTVDVNTGKSQGCQQTYHATDQTQEPAT